MKKSNQDFNADVVRGTAAIYYLRTSKDYTAAKEEDQDDRKKAFISVSVIAAFFFFYTIIVGVSNL